MSNSEAASANLSLNPRPLLSVPEAADMLAVSTRYIRVLLARGAIPVVRLGRRTLVRRTDVDAIIARGGLVDAA
ncbi:MAG: helix-turn-helix domain-containing protein [Polyangia bacterium]|jgi:excisionase family DNA binding protein